MWNNSTLRPPPINSFLGSTTSIDAVKLKTSLQGLNTVIKYCEETLLLEEKLLFNVLCKFKTRLRKHMEIRFMAKIKRHLERYNEMNLIKDINRFLLSLPNKTSGEAYFPTKQMMEYMLVRLQGYSKLLSRIIELSAETAKYMIKRLMLGHYWILALIVLSIVSRIWEVCHHIIEACCDCYQNVIPVLSKLQLSGVKWLEDDYVFPINLREWLDLTWTLDDLKSFTGKKLDIATYVISDDEDDDIQYMCSYKNDYIVIDDSIKLNDNDVEFINEYVDIIDTPRNRKYDFFKVGKETVIDVESDSSTNIQRKDSDIEIVDVNTEHIFNNDIGEVVNRDDVVDDALQLITSTPIRSKDRKRGKRKRSCEIEIQKAVLQSVTLVTPSASPTKPGQSVITNNNGISKLVRKRTRQTDDNESVISISDSSEISQKLNRRKKAAESVIMLDESFTDQNISDADTSLHSTTLTVDDTDLSQIDLEVCAASSISGLDVSGHNLKNVKTIKDFNAFLNTEKLLRSKSHPLRITANVNKAQWKAMIKSVEAVFVTRKRLRQDKKTAVKLAKNTVKKFLK